MSVAEAVTPPPEFVPSDPENRDRYEIIDGQFVGMPPMSAKASVLAARLARLVSNFGIEHDLGEAYPEVLFKLPLPVDRNRRPDVAFVPYSRWPRGRDLPDTNAWDVLPDLCVEVVSPTDLADETQDKLQEYLRAGVRLVWVVYPRQQIVYAHEPSGAVHRLPRGATLEGGPVLPGFRLPLAELFPEPPAPPG